MRTTTKNYISLLSAIVICIFLQFVNPFSVSPQANKVLAIAALMITLWVTEALPMPVVALLPLVLFPLLGIAKIEDTAAPYADKIIFLFMGGFMLGLAIEKWHLHKRIALGIVNITGTSGNRIILGFILASGLLSMWLSNTATTMMMFPIAISVIGVMEANHQQNGNIKHFSVAILLSIAYASNFGGIATIIGTPPNVAYVGQLQKYYGYSFDFSQWMMICTPLSIIILFSLYVVMTKWLYPNHIKADLTTKTLIKSEVVKLGKLSKAEKRVMVVFITTALLWIFKDLINKLNLVKLDDTIIALLGGITLFIVPSGEADEHITLLNWKDTKNMSWGILLLFGGGISLATQLEKVGLIAKLGAWIAAYAGTNLFVLILMIAIISTFISEVMSNVAQVIVFAPVIAGMADALHINPIILGLPMTLGASCAGMLPMGTPPNAIVFASGQLQLKHMIKTGFIMNIICIILITMFCYFLVPLVVQPIIGK
jgi:sodium-dependent dicarboxylate transporter 2/3/5